MVSQESEPNVLLHQILFRTVSHGSTARSPRKFADVPSGLAAISKAPRHAVGGRAESMSGLLSEQGLPGPPVRCSRETYKFRGSMLGDYEMCWRIGPMQVPWVWGPMGFDDTSAPTKMLRLLVLAGVGIAFQKKRTIKHMLTHP